MSTILSKHLKLRPIYPRPLVLYKHLLRQSQAFFDEATRYNYHVILRDSFRKSANLTGYAKICQKDIAFDHLKRLIRANAGSSEDATHIIGLTYGFVGPLVALRYKTRMRDQFHNRTMDASKTTAPFKPLGWGILPNPAYPVHPRVLSSFSVDPHDFMQEMLVATASLPISAREAYQKWGDLSWLPSTPVYLHGPHEWSAVDVAQKRSASSPSTDFGEVSDLLLDSYGHTHKSYFSLHPFERASLPQPPEINI